jgi:hypothetical protein
VVGTVSSLAENDQRENLVREADKECQYRER